MLHFLAGQASQELKTHECKLDYAQMMDLQEVTEDIDIVSNYLP